MYGTQGDLDTRVETTIAVISVTIDSLPTAPTSTTPPAGPPAPTAPTSTTQPAGSPVTNMPTFLRDSSVGAQSVTLVEDVDRTVGGEISQIIQGTTPTSVGTITICGFPSGSTVEYVNSNNETVRVMVGDDGLSVDFTGPNAFSNLASLSVTNPADADTGYDLGVEITNGNDPTATQSFPVSVDVLAVADMPMVLAENATVVQNSSVPLIIRAINSVDTDGSEKLSVELCVQSDGNGGTIGDLEPSNIMIAGVSFFDEGDGNYRVEAEGDTAAERESRLNAFLMNGGILFVPRNDITGEFPQAIKVRAISRETGKKCWIYDIGQFLTSNNRSHGTRKRPDFWDSRR